MKSHLRCIIPHLYCFTALSPIEKRFARTSVSNIFISQMKKITRSISILDITTIRENVIDWKMNIGISEILFYAYIFKNY